MGQNKLNRTVVLACTLVAALAAFCPAWAQTTEPILRVEVGAHNAGVWSIAVDPSNRILATGSEDKTVRVWDISGGGRLLRTLRPPIGEGEEGRIFAVAISPDGVTVACGGQTGSVQQGDACVYLFDRTTGALTRRLGGLPGGAQHIAYTPDGRFLALVMSKGGMRVYRLPDYALVAEDREYGDFAKCVEIDPTGSRLATACYDGFIRLYDLSILKARDASSPLPLAPVSKIRPPGGQRSWGLAFSPDGTRLAVGQHFSPKVDVLEVKGNVLEHAYSPNMEGVKSGPGTDLRAVAWSADGRFLYAGGYYVRKGHYQVRKWADGGRGAYRDLSMRVDLPFFHLLSLRSGGIAYCARDGSVGMLNDQDEIVLLGAKTLPIYAGIFDGFLLSRDGSAIQFSFEAHGKAPALLSVGERRLTDVLSSPWAHMKAGFTFQAPITAGLGVSDWKNSLSPKLNGKPLPLKNDPAASLAIKPDRSGFLLGSTSHLYSFSSEGKTLWRVRTPSAVFGVNTNGQVAVAAVGDGTIRWYRVSDGKELLAFFPHADRKRWVLWTPTGYYDASPGGEDFTGWHVNNGKDRAADFFPASRFRSTYHRPDVIDQVLKTLDESEAIRLANEESGRKQVAEVSVRDQLPPVVAIASPADGAEVSGTPVKVHYSARSQQPLSGLKVLVDGRPVSAEGSGKSVKESGELSVQVPARDCEISVIAENRHAASEPATVRLRWKGAAAKEEFQIKPKLYVLAVGISQYQDAELRLDLAAKDALDFGSVWNDQKGRMYNGVEVRSLTDSQATKGNILDGLEWIQRQVTQNDVAVLFFAGHGVNDPNGMFYFLPVDADQERLKRTGISQSDITSTVAAIAGKVLVFMDACHSGNLMGKIKRRGVTVVTSAVVNELASAENGAVVFSSSTGRQVSQENPEWGNGAFTKGLVEGLSGKADYKGTGRITLNMLDLYVSERVKELTQGQQTPSTVKPPNVPDFPIAVAAKSR